MNIHIVCRNWQADRVLPRFVRYLMQGLGWSVGGTPSAKADLNYWLAYFEGYRNRQWGTTTKTATYLTHFEPGPKGEAFMASAQAATIRVVMNLAQVPLVSEYGPTIQPPLPVERDRFVPVKRAIPKQPVIGFSGFTYGSGRKGENLAKSIVAQLGERATFIATGRGWPCETKHLEWINMPRFYQGLDLYICTATIEGGPMTTLEALACGVPVVIPVGVGIHDEIPETPGIYRYSAGNIKSLGRAVQKALGELGTLNRAALRDCMAWCNIQAFCEVHQTEFARVLNPPSVLPAVQEMARLSSVQGNSGIYIVAFGDPARTCAVRLLKSIHKCMPETPTAVVSDRPIGGETVFVQQPDSDIGGRIAKLKVYDLAPKDWQYILYLDADVELVSDVGFFFQLLADGWEFAICKDAHLHDTVMHLERRNNTDEHRRTVGQLASDAALAINGGVWSFRRCDRTRRFFKRWYDEWAKYKGRDQSALIRAMYADPLRVFWLGNEWNTLITMKGEEYPPGKKGTAGVIHHVGHARRWEGQVPTGKGLTDPEAWEMVKRFEEKRRARAKGK